MSGILIDVNARTSKSEQDLARINESLRNIERSTNSASKTLSRTFIGLGSAVVSSGLLYSLKSISTEFTNLENKIALVTGKTEKLIQVQSKLFKIAEETRGSLAGTVSTFSSFGRALRDAGSSTENILKATKSVQQAIAISGSSAESASAALVQLGQGLSSGVLRGEELNSVLEQTPRIAQAIADELGVNLGQLRRLGADGKLLSDVVFKALLNQAEEINKEFSTLSPTLQQAGNALSDSVKIYISELDKGLGLSQNISEITFKLAKFVKNSADNAFELGNNLRLSFNTISRVIGPISSILGQLGKQFLNIIPGLNLTRTLRGDIREAVRFFDKEFFGGIIGLYKRTSIIDLITIESDVEKALRQLRRLSPRYWAASGFDVKTIRQVLSTENILLYGKAFSNLADALKGNTNGIGTAFIELARKVDFSFKAFSRYLGLRADTLIAFSRGQLETFFTSLAEITRGLFNVRIRFFEINKLLTVLLQPSIEAFGDALLDAFSILPENILKLTKSILQTAISLTSGVVQILKELLFTELNINYKEILDFILDSLTAFTKAVADKLSLNKPLDNIKEFGKNVIEIFREIYDKVIGNSWWTDTIENVVDTSNDLWQKSSNGLNKFKNNFEKLFKNIFDLNLSNKISFDNIISGFKSNNLLETFETIFKNTQEIFNKLFKSFPQLMQVALTAGAGVFIYALFPPSVLKTILIGTIISSLATNGTLIAEKFGAALTGGSLAASIGDLLGRSLGFLFANFVKTIPQIINALTGFISAFFKGFTSQLPSLLGPISSFIFSIANLIGAAGPLGLIGTFLIGKSLNLFSLIAKLGPVKDLLEYFDIKVGEGSKESQGKVGKIFQYLFGKIGKERTIASVLGVLDLLGAFESIFAGSPLTQMAARGGILYTILFGQEGVAKIKNSIFTSVIKPIGDSLRSFAENRGGNVKTIYDIIFGTEGTTAERLSLVLRPLIDKITGNIVDYVSPKLKTGLDFLTTLFLGKDPKATISKISNQLKDTGKSAITSIASFIKPVVEPATQMLDRVRYQMWLMRNASNQQVAASQNLFNSFAQNATSTAERLGGQNGLIGKLFFGKFGKQVLVGSILGLASVFAFANVQTQETIKTPIDELVENLNKLNLKPLFEKIFEPLNLLLTVSILSSFLVFKSNILKIFSEIKLAATAMMASVAAAVGATDLAAALGGGAGGRRGRRGTAATAAVGTIGISAAGGAIAGIVADSLSTGLAVGGVIATILQVLPAKIVASVTTALISGIKTALGAVFSLAALKAILVTGAIAALGIFLFGPNREFFKDVQLAIDKIKEFFGIASKAKVSDRGVSLENELFLKSRQIESTFSLKSINLDKLQTKDREKLNEKLKEYNDLINTAKEEESDYGLVSSGTRERLQLLDKGLKNLTTTLALKNTKTQSASEFIENLTGLGPTSRFGGFRLSLEQLGKDAAFYGSKAALKFQRAIEFDPARKAPLTEALNDLERRQSTSFNAYFRPLAKTEKELLEIAKISEQVKITNDELETRLLSARQLYEAQADRVKRAQIDLLGGFRDAPVEEQAALIILRENYKELLRNKIAYDRIKTSANLFKAEITGIESVFKNVLKLDIDFDDIFAIDQADLKRLKDLRDEAKLLGEQLLDVSDVIKSNEIRLRISEVRRQTNLAVDEAKIKESALRPQIIAQQLVKDLGLTYSEEFLKSLDDAAATALVESLTQLKRQISDSQQKSSQLKDTSGKSLKQFSKEISDNTAAIDRSVRDSVRNTSSEILLLEQNSQKLGLTYDNLILKYGIKNAISQISNLENLLQQLEVAKTNRNDSRIAILTKQIQILKEEINRVPLDFQSTIGYLNTGGFTITAEDIFNTPEIFKDAINISKRFQDLEIKFKNLSNTFTELDIFELLSEKLKISNDLLNQFLKTIGNTSAKLTQIINKFGIANDQLSSISDQGIDAVIEIEKLSTSLDEISKRASTKDEFRFIMALKTNLESISNFVKDKFSKTFSNTFNKINNTLELSLTESQFANLPKDLIATLETYSTYIQKNLEKIRTTGKSISGEAPKEFFEKFDEISRRTKFVKFFSDISKSFNEILFEGFSSQFERIKDILPNLKLEKTDFANISLGLRKEFARQATLIKTIKSIIETLPGISEDSPEFKILTEILPDGSNLQEVFDKFISAVNINLTNLPADIKTQIENILRGQTDPIAQQISALDTNSTRLLDLRVAVENLIQKFSGNIPGFSEGGYVKGSGTDTSDSIQALLSDGEFVVNAKSTEKYLPLLELLNNSKTDSNKLIFNKPNSENTFKNIFKIPVAGGVLEPAKVNKGRGFKWSKQFQKGGFNNISRRDFLAIDKIKDKTKELDSISLNPALKETKDINSLLNLKSDKIANRREMFGPALLQTLFDLSSFKTKYNVASFALGIGGAIGEYLINPLIDKIITEATEGKSKSLGDYLYYYFNERIPNKKDGGSIFGPGTETSDSILARLSNGEFVVNAKSTKKYRSLLEQINSAKGFNQGGIAGTGVNSQRIEITQSRINLGPLLTRLDNLANALEKRIIQRLPEEIQGITKAKTLGIDFDELKFKSLTPEAQDKFQNLVDKAFDDIISANRFKTREAILQSSKSLQEVQDFLEDNLPKFTNKIREAGIAFADEVSKSFSDAFKDLLKGKRDEDKSVLQTFGKSILDRITNSVIDTFAAGLTDPLVGKEGILTKASKSLGESLFSLGGDALKKGSSFLFGTPASKTEEGNQIPIKGFIDKFTEGFKSIDFKGLWTTFTDSFKNIDFSGMWDLFKKGFDFVLKFLGFAQGGYVKGPGTGTSDSIPAMLSNGEFVINAKASKDHFNLLSAINNGSFKRFAEGGLVSTALVATPVMADMTKSNPISTQNQQVININITGDVSRQTRAQIYEMLPSIAEGVNIHNKEKGYKR